MSYPNFCNNVVPGTFTSRVVGDFYCSGSGCTAGGNGSWGPEPYKHGARILGAFADLLDGQDACWGSSSARNARSFGAHEASLHLFRNGGLGGEIEALEYAADHGIDIVSVSQTYNDWDCDNARDAVGDLTAAEDYALSHDVVLVRAANNFVRACRDDCHTDTGASSRAEIIVAGGVHPEDSGGLYGDWPLMGEPDTDLTDYPNCAPRTWVPISGTQACARSCSIHDDCCAGFEDQIPDNETCRNTFRCTDGSCEYVCWSSAVGGADLRVAGTVRNNVRGIIDVLAPAFRDNNPRYDSTTNYSYVTDPDAAGTSNAAPHVAASLVSLLDFAVVQQLDVHEPGIANVLVLLMGNGQRGTAGDSHVPSSQIANTYVGLDRLWGAGRLKFRYPSHTDMDNPWFWDWGAFSLLPGSTHYESMSTGTPLSSAVDSCSIAISWNEFNLDAGEAFNAARMSLALVSTSSVNGTCPSQPNGSITVHYTDASYDVQKLVRVRGSDMQALHGRCLYARTYFYSDATLGGRTVYFTWFWEDLARECAENLGQCDNSIFQCQLEAGCVE